MPLPNLQGIKACNMSGKFSTTVPIVFGIRVVSFSSMCALSLRFLIALWYDGFDVSPIKFTLTSQQLNSVYPLRWNGAVSWNPGFADPFLRTHCFDLWPRCSLYFSFWGGIEKIVSAVIHLRWESLACGPKRLYGWLFSGIWLFTPTYVLCNGKAHLRTSNKSSKILTRRRACSLR